MHDVSAIGRKLAGFDGSFVVLALWMSLIHACFHTVGTIEVSQQWFKSVVTQGWVSLEDLV